MPSIVKEFTTFIALFFVYSVVHGIATNLYAHFCAPKEAWQYLFAGLWGTQAPHCRALYWMFVSSHDLVDKATNTALLWITTKVASVAMLGKGS
jgi:hypothetical protein